MALASSPRPLSPPPPPTRPPSLPAFPSSLGLQGAAPRPVRLPRRRPRAVPGAGHGLLPRRPPAAGAVRHLQLHTAAGAAAGCGAGAGTAPQGRGAGEVGGCALATKEESNASGSAICPDIDLGYGRGVSWPTSCLLTEPPSIATALTLRPWSYVPLCVPLPARRPSPRWWPPRCRASWAWSGASSSTSS